MPYPLKPGIMYMMPTHFGPYTGPRRGPDGRGYACADNPKKMVYAVSFLTKADQLNRLLPPGFSLQGEPVITVFNEQLKEIEWLAGRGYNTLGVTFPAQYEGASDRAAGPLLTVLWENLADPILTGREQLGFSKIYCELPEPVVRSDETQITASWLGFRFMDMRLTGMTEVPSPDFPPPPEEIIDGVAQGLLHYKYIPKTGDWGVADAEYACLMPFGGGNEVTKQFWRGEGTVKFHNARWEDLPTQFTIVNALADLEIVEWRGATITRSVGGKDLSDQRALD
ncbi:MAG: acetoacetate decarboxylase family protein [Boseongicola sp.]|nr:acetoacetate decarboxylase family protein [Boseongicola sp.]MDE0345078.1 acetoacetate decarboxylase family protein [Boseongicola sp.]